MYRCHEYIHDVAGGEEDEHSRLPDAVYVHSSEPRLHQLYSV